MLILKMPKRRIQRKINTYPRGQVKYIADGRRILNTCTGRKSIMSHRKLRDTVMDNSERQWPYIFFLFYSKMYWEVKYIV